MLILSNIWLFVIILVTRIKICVHRYTYTFIRLLKPYQTGVTSARVDTTLQDLNEIFVSVESAEVIIANAVFNLYETESDICLFS